MALQGKARSSTHMTVKEYLAVVGSTYSDADAQKAGPELLKLARKGKSTAADIVHAAQRATSPLHPFFEWADSAAAIKYREGQARNLARSITVRVTAPDGSEHTVRAFHAVFLEGDSHSRQDDRVYLSIEQVQAEPILAQQIVDDARRKLLAWRKQYASYAAVFGGVFEAIDRLDEAA